MEDYLMTELSHAAKAILVAEAKSRCLREERGCHPTDSDWNGCWICVHRKGVAAALRAAVEHLGYELELDDLSGTILHVVNVNSLFAIADELETE
jgi:hypothetical protein